MPQQLDELTCFRMFIDVYIDILATNGTYFSHDFTITHVNNYLKKEYKSLPYAKKTKKTIRNFIRTKFYNDNQNVTPDVHARQILTYIIEKDNILTLEKFIRSISQLYNWMSIVKISGNTDLKILQKIVNCVKYAKPKINFNVSKHNNSYMTSVSIKNMKISEELLNDVANYFPEYLMCFPSDFKLTKNILLKVISNIEEKDTNAYNFNLNCIFNIMQKYNCVPTDFVDVNPVIMYDILSNENLLKDKNLKILSYTFNRSNVPKNYFKKSASCHNDCSFIF